MIRTVQFRIDTDTDDMLSKLCGALTTRSALIRSLIHRAHDEHVARELESKREIVRDARLAQLATKRRGLLPGMEEDTKTRVYARLAQSGEILERSESTLAPRDYERIETFAVMRRHDGSTYDKSLGVGAAPVWTVRWQERNPGVGETRHDDPFPTEELAHDWKREIDDRGYKVVVESRIVAPDGHTVESRSSPADADRKWIVRWTGKPGTWDGQKADGSVARYFATEEEARESAARWAELGATVERNTEVWQPSEPAREHVQLPEPPRIMGRWQICWRDDGADRYEVRAFASDGEAMAFSYTLAPTIVDVLFLEPAEL